MKTMTGVLAQCTFLALRTPYTRAISISCGEIPTARLAQHPTRAAGFLSFDETGLFAPGGIGGLPRLDLRSDRETAPGEGAAWGGRRTDSIIIGLTITGRDPARAGERCPG